MSLNNSKNSLHNIHQIARKLRREETSAEKKLWRYLKDRRLGEYKFRRQHPIGRFIVDFYCAEKKLAVEIDGDTHFYQKEYDKKRTECLKNKGISVIRFWNSEVLQNIQGVLQVILEECQRK